MSEYYYQLEDWRYGRQVVIRGEKGKLIDNYKYDWGIAPEDNFTQAQNIIEEREEADREQAIREEEEGERFDIARVDKVRRSINPLARRYQYIIQYNGTNFFSIMTNRLFGEEELADRIERMLNRNYGMQLESVESIELVQSV